ncbi:MAG: PIN domain-containing protein [Haloarculaceae archaeon]
MILDSCFLIDLMAGDEAAVAKLDELVAKRRPLAVSTPSVTEIERGLGREELDRFDAVVADLDVVAYDRSMARRAATILRTLDEQGTPVGAVDAMVAATALERDGAVVTRNVEEFRRVEGVRAVPY